MPADRLADEELAALEESIHGRGPVAWGLAWSRLESLVAEVRASRGEIAGLRQFLTLIYGELTRLSQNPAAARAALALEEIAERIKARAEGQL